MSQIQPQQPYTPPAGYRPVRPTNGLAIASLVTGLLGMALIPVVLGHIAMRQIRQRDEAGSGLAIVGLVLGYLGIAGYVLLFGLVIGGVWLGVSNQ